MKAIFLIAILTTTTTFFGCPPHPSQEIISETMPTGERRPVLVELYTSEGCSSCPPADRVLSSLQNDQPIPNAEVITLGFHVDYWDGGSWRDRFSSRSFTKRQETYAGKFGIGATYTPQIVVDGVREFVGSRRGDAINAIAQSANLSKGFATLTIANGKLTAKVTGLTDHGDATVYLAVAESGLANKVSGGENSGSTLEHASVVRELKVIGSISGRDNAGNFDAPVPKNTDWITANIRFVVFVQDNKTLKILAVNQIRQ